MYVLVADDDDDIRFLVGTLLGRQGWQVTEATSGAAALEILGGEGGTAAFDALVLDQNMPPGSGTEVIEWVRSRDTATPVVLFTGFVEAIDQAAVDRLGVTVLDKVAITQLPSLLGDLIG